MTIFAIIDPGFKVTLHLRGLISFVLDPNIKGVADRDGDGLDELETEVGQMALFGSSFQGGRAFLKLRSAKKSPFMRSLGVIEETSNANRGVLDVPPFTTTGRADSFFDVFVDILVIDPDLKKLRRLHNETPLRLHAMVSFALAGLGDVYMVIDPNLRIALLDEAGRPAGVTITGVQLTPGPSTTIGKGMPEIGQGLRWRVPDSRMEGQQARVFDLAGREVYDSGWVPGQTLLSDLLNILGRRLAKGVYLYVVTVRGYDGVVRREVRKLVVSPRMRR